jgi:hypothetical protein
LLPLCPFFGYDGFDDLAETGPFAGRAETDEVRQQICSGHGDLL